MLIKLEYSPYFIADDIKEAEGTKPLLADEALAFFRYILSVSNDPATIRFVCNSNSRGRKSIEVLYDLSDSFGAEFLSRNHSNRYFHFVPCDQCLVSGIDEVEFSRKLFLSFFFESSQIGFVFGSDVSQDKEQSIFVSLDTHIFHKLAELCGFQ